MRRLTLLLTSPRVAPGLMTRAAWEALDSADVIAASSDHPLALAVRAAGYQVVRRPVPEQAEAGGGHLVWLASDEEAVTLPGRLAPGVAAGEGPEVEVLHGSYDVPGARLLDLVAVMDRLRRECPWDREQTHRSLSKYLLEETYETLEAIESGDYPHLREELGDLLLQVFFHARIAAEAGTGTDDSGFTIDDVAAGIVDKLVYRHPHVFAGLEVSGPEEVDANWETLKAAEKRRSSPLDGIPAALPALALADKVMSRLDVATSADGDVGDIGSRLLGLVAEARAQGIDAEQALRDAVRDLVRRAAGVNG